MQNGVFIGRMQPFHNGHLSAIQYALSKIDGRLLELRRVYKDPVTDPGKQSKAGRLELIREGNSYRTVELAPDQDYHPDSALVTVFENGEILNSITFEACRKRMELLTIEGH